MSEELISKYAPKRKVSPFQIRLREPLGVENCPYAYRWVLNLGLFAIRIHQWIRSDDKRYFHDHPWWFWTIVLRGGYTDVSVSGNEFDVNSPNVKRDILKKFSIRYRPADHRHYVEVPKEGALTLLITGPPIRKWGFWIKGKLKRPIKFFRAYGHPPCDEQ